MGEAVAAAISSLIFSIIVGAIWFAYQYWKEIKKDK